MSQDNPNPTNPEQRDDGAVIITLRITALPARQGWVWYKNALRLIHAHPLILVVANSWVVFTMMFLAGLIPVMGMVIGYLLSPLFSFGLADMAQQIRLRQVTYPMSVFAPFAHKEVRGRLLNLGMMTATLLFLLGLVGMSLLNGESVAQLGKHVTALEGLRDNNEMRAQMGAIRDLLLADKRTIATFVGTFAAGLFIQTILMYAPLLVVWQNLPARIAAPISTLTVLRNLLPAAVCAIPFVLTTLGLLAFCSLLSLIAPSFMMLAGMIFMVLLNTLINAVIYSSYYDIIKNSLSQTVHDNVEQAINDSFKK